jgi:hypothetical protein
MSDIRYLVIAFDPESNTGKLVTVFGLDTISKAYGPVHQSYGDGVDLIRLARHHGLPSAPKWSAKP